MFLPSSIAIHLVSLLLSSPIFKIIVSGTDNSIPTGPNNQPQKSNDKTRAFNRKR